MTFGNHTIYSTENTVNLPQLDTNSNIVIDSIETTPQSFTLRNIPSSYILEPRASIILETYLEQGGIQASDNTSRIDLVPLRIANLDTGKIFTPSDPEWESLRKESLSLA